MSLADKAHNHTTLLDGFLCIFDLEDTALGRAAFVSWMLDVT